MVVTNTNTTTPSTASDDDTLHSQDHHPSPSTSTSHSLPKRPWRRYITPYSDILAHHYPGKGTEDSPYLVDWLEDDAENPLTWGQKYKWFVTVTVAISTLAVAMASSTL
jgi:hypothetical protein